ncbi:aldo/keto reductase [Pelobacter seleniigenes]|uniref:aldo/keto reductase n=1 Tax=Pelobacter seleniigenes TaxID=407188 RepID=UPI0004A6E7C5|nr:aldo/keto reductase [Pelobacter seleniigenes]
MLYRKVPKNGDELSILGFGCMRLPTRDGQIDEPRAIAQIRSAIDRGVNYIDTAWPYHAGQSEPLVGKALQEGYRERVKLATKLPSFLVKTREDMDRFLNAQLKKLETDHIDYYLVHTLTGPVWDKMVALGIFEFLDQAKADGRIINAGFSYHGLPEDFNRIVDAYPWEFCQIQYNYLDESYQAGVAGLKYAASKNLAVIIMEPLRGGNLGRPTPPPAIEEIWAKAEFPRTPVAWALLWIWNSPEVTVILSGMNEESHIDENLALAGQARPGVLNSSELELVAEAGMTYRRLMKVGCTGCGYCMPCPVDVNIPICFEVFNNFHMFNQSDVARLSYAFRMGGDLTDGVPGYASQCVQCGQCIEKCPQQIKIPDMLSQVVADLEDEGLPQRLDTMRKIMLKQAQ